ncbi:cell cycle checkpoint control protein RAD9B isoform X1 [Phymastichus coffea]|uniref:cell cycle checkpoint control protein RAD9B isoform X1 n=1 Tax=Phymastichus coffea TaxID=108790 RepID=UPI00273A97F4|nr:cell cycle checkpoint control protein RAD9B isoform X1 [Phymastichus coffea]XP_058806196.1 cell cycle checkpoint control protein RAD9B isoform X1 [Phymastichus coffea]XP_058806197.1 cell cycle checkpoint control protein RAD9B isoform X1 [Phymastichus coffea]
MKCIIPSGNIKIIAKAIQMLAKIGEEMFVVPQEDCLSLRSVNGANSAFSDVSFYDNYFSYYAYENSENSESLKCKIPIKSALAVFKIASVLDKQIESCQIELQPNAEKLKIVLKYKNNVMKTHLLTIIDSETIKANYKKDGTANQVCIQPKVLNDVVQNFQQNLIEITFEVQKDKALIRSYIDENSNIIESRTQLVFGGGEFDSYAIEFETTITFCLKELRAILHFSEALQHPIEIYFDRPGKPVVFICKSDTLETNLVLATLNPETDSVSQSTASSRPTVLPKKATTRRAPAKKGVKSLSKNSFNGTRKNATETNAGSTESPGRISDVSDTPRFNAGRKSSSSSRTCTPKVNSERSIISNREIVSSTEHISSSPLLKRKSESTNPVDCDNDDLIQNSPPRHASKKAKLIFKRCFQTTLDPQSISGNNDVEVEDSGEED